MKTGKHTIVTTSKATIITKCTAFHLQADRPAHRQPTASTDKSARRSRLSIRRMALRPSYRLAERKIPINNQPDRDKSARRLLTMKNGRHVGHYGDNSNLINISCRKTSPATSQQRSSSSPWLPHTPFSTRKKKPRMQIVESQSTLPSSSPP